MSGIDVVAFAAAMDAAWPGLPPEMSVEQAERRTRAAVEAYLEAARGASSPHLPNALDDVCDAFGQQGWVVVDKRIVRELGEVDVADRDSNLWRLSVQPMQLLPVEGGS